jgi:hypothetical protein
MLTTLLLHISAALEENSFFNSNLNVETLVIYMDTSYKPAEYLPY